MKIFGYFTLFSMGAFVLAPPGDGSLSNDRGKNDTIACQTGHAAAATVFVFADEVGAGNDDKAECRSRDQDR